jgi:hypothetical protein
MEAMFLVELTATRQEPQPGSARLAGARVKAVKGSPPNRSPTISR